jgi:glycosyltransferase involved in cell wall biosynthesis
MRILNVAYPFAPVGPDAVGGAEQILSQLDAALVASGHASLVLACAGSKVFGEHLSFPIPPGEITPACKAVFYLRYREMIEEIIGLRRIDLVHFHGVDFLEYLPRTDLPLLATLHLPPEWYPREIFNGENANLFLHCVSKTQSCRCPLPCASVPNLLDPIENGVAISARGPHARRNFALSLGRICPEKGFHLAMEAAKVANVPLYIGGEVFPYHAHLSYFENEIRPRQDNRRRFLGPLGLARKTRFLAAAKCVLVPSLVPETSSLVTMEALACGTPVIAFRQGALPELIEHGRTGFLVDSVAEMAKAIQHTGELSRDTCRAAALNRFSVETMTARYLARYEQLILRRARGFPETSIPVPNVVSSYAA